MTLPNFTDRDPQFASLTVDELRELVNLGRAAIAKRREADWPNVAGDSAPIEAAISAGAGADHELYLRAWAGTFALGGSAPDLGIRGWVNTSRSSAEIYRAMLREVEHAAEEHPDLIRAEDNRARFVIDHTGAWRAEIRVERRIGRRSGGRARVETLHATDATAGSAALALVRAIGVLT